MPSTEIQINEFIRDDSPLPSEGAPRAEPNCNWWEKGEGLVVAPRFASAVSPSDIDKDNGSEARDQRGRSAVNADRIRPGSLRDLLARQVATNMPPLRHLCREQRLGERQGSGSP